MGHFVTQSAPESHSSNSDVNESRFCFSERNGLVRTIKKWTGCLVPFKCLHSTDAPRICKSNCPFLMSQTGFYGNKKFSFNTVFWSSSECRARMSSLHLWSAKDSSFSGLSVPAEANMMVVSRSAIIPETALAAVIQAWVPLFPACSAESTKDTWNMLHTLH